MRLIDQYLSSGTWKCPPGRHQTESTSRGAKEIRQSFRKPWKRWVSRGGAEEKLTGNCGEKFCDSRPLTPFCVTSSPRTWTCSTAPRACPSHLLKKEAGPQADLGPNSLHQAVEDNAARGARAGRHRRCAGTRTGQSSPVEDAFAYRTTDSMCPSRPKEATWAGFRSGAMVEPFAKARSSSRRAAERRGSDAVWLSFDSGHRPTTRSGANSRMCVTSSRTCTAKLRVI